MKNLILAAAVLSLALGRATPAQAGHGGAGVAIAAALGFVTGAAVTAGACDTPRYAVPVTYAPVYAPAPVVYAAPPIVYAPAPAVVYAPAPPVVVCAPPVVAVPAPVVYAPAYYPAPRYLVRPPMRGHFRGRW